MSIIMCIILSIGLVAASLLNIVSNIVSISLRLANQAQKKRVKTLLGEGGVASGLDRGDQGGAGPAGKTTRGGGAAVPVGGSNTIRRGTSCPFMWDDSPAMAASPSSGWRSCTYRSNCR